MSPSKPSTTIESQLEDSLREIAIPPRPVILDRVNEEMHKDDPDFNHLASIIAADVALSASLIKITNSPFFGFRGRVHTPREALMLLGLNVAGKAISGIVMRQAFPKSPQLERFWDASALIARLAGWLAPRLTNNRLRADDAYTFGLFRDCGIPILLSRRASYFDVLVEANHDDSRCFTEIEDLALPTNHAIVGSMLSQSWWLTDETSLSIRHHHDLAFIAANTIPPTLNSRHMIAVAQLAEHLLQQHTKRSFTQEWAKLGPACMHLLKLTDENIAEMLIEAVPVMEAED